MGIKQLYNDNLRKLPNEYGDVSVMVFQVLFQTQYLMRCHLCTERTTRDQERCPGGHPTKPEPNQILLHLQQLVVV